MNAAWIASIFTVGELIIIVLLGCIILSQFRLRRAILRIEDK